VRPRDWTSADYYRDLGVSPNATRAEISAAFRQHARVLHPDSGTAEAAEAPDASAPADFVRVATAYRVLSGPLREEYDRDRRRGQVGRPPVGAGTDVVAASASGGWRLSRRGARAARWAGAALVVAGVSVAGGVIALQASDARLRGDGVAVEAAVVRQNSRPRLSFTTRDGHEVVADVPDPKSGGWRVGESIDIRYDPDDPTRVVTTRPTLARDITLWVVAVKLFVVGVVLVVVGVRTGRRPEYAL
jgi:hypothetical protein